MKCQILFPGKKNKKSITNLSSAKLAQRVVKVKMTFNPSGLCSLREREKMNRRVCKYM